jgi:hypothetical protein
VVSSSISVDAIGAAESDPYYLPAQSALMFGQRMISQAPRQCGGRALDARFLNMSSRPRSYSLHVLVGRAV